ncbi:MAG: FkbM family methyltransferase [Desulfosarcina sp.]|jgi:FkbM family methyltransferase
MIFHDQSLVALFIIKRLNQITANVIRSDGKTWPWHTKPLSKKIAKHLFRLRDQLVRKVEIIDGQSHYRFRCANWLELSRCMMLFTKEPGTCEWIRKVGTGSVFYDIGANIGLFSILAAERVGQSGKVFAFEPHAANFSRLLDNIAVNELQHIITPCSFALHQANGYFNFIYDSRDVGTSNSQLSFHRKEDKVSNNQTGNFELKYAVSIDNLIFSESFPPPDYIKIDVDGNELPILRGMSNLLKSKKRPKSIQVEICNDDNPQILSFMENHNYLVANAHYSIFGMEAIAQGGQGESYVCNTIFQPKD